MRIFHDSKTFVDLKLKKPPNETLEAFNDFMDKFNGTPTENELKMWVDDNFDPAGSEMMKVNPEDFKPQPAVLNRIADVNYKKFASDLNYLWIELCRKIKDDVKVGLILFK